MTLPGRSVPIRVEPTRLPDPEPLVEPAEPAPEREPSEPREPAPEREPEEVPA